MCLARFIIRPMCRNKERKKGITTATNQSKSIHFDANVFPILTFFYAIVVIAIVFRVRAAIVTLHKT